MTAFIGQAPYELHYHLRLPPRLQPALKRARLGESSSRAAAPAAAAAREPVVLEQALQGFQLQEVALFLRLVYFPDDGGPGRLHSELASLAGAACLAHQLDAPRVLRHLIAAMQGTGEFEGQRSVERRHSAEADTGCRCSWAVSRRGAEAPKLDCRTAWAADRLAGMQHHAVPSFPYAPAAAESLDSHTMLVAWLGVAEHCQQGELRACCIRRLATLLLADRNGDWEGGPQRRGHSGVEQAMEDLNQLQASQALLFVVSFSQV